MLTNYPEMTIPIKHLKDHTSEMFFWLTLGTYCLMLSDIFFMHISDNTLFDVTPSCGDDDHVSFVLDQHTELDIYKC